MAALRGLYDIRISPLSRIFLPSVEFPAWEQPPRAVRAFAPCRYQDRGGIEKIQAGTVLHSWVKKNGSRRGRSLTG